MKQELIAMINRMNEEELAKAYNLLKNMVQSNQQINFQDETTNYMKYRSLCSVPQELLQARGHGTTTVSREQTREEQLAVLVKENGTVSEKDIREIFSYGREMLRDGKIETGLEWIRFASKYDLKEALFLMGYCCEQGIGTKKDIAVAKKFYRRGADLDARFKKYHAPYGFGLSREGFEKASLFGKNVYDKDPIKKEREVSDEKNTKAQRRFVMEYNELMEDGIHNGIEDGRDMTVFGSDILRSDIWSITILNHVKQIPSNYWDVSKKQDGSILAWVIDKGRFKDLVLYSKKRIMAGNCERLFAWYISLQEIQFNNWFYTKDAVSMNKMFMGCYNLKTVDVSSFDTSNVTNMGCMFYDCHKLTHLNLSSFNTSKVTDMGRMFENCYDMNTITVSSFDTSNVIDMSYMFLDCQNLKRLDLSSFDTSNVVHMESMFTDCYNLNTLDCTSFNTRNVESMEEMFSFCRSLKKINLTSFNFSKVKTVEAMFMGCTELVEINVNPFNIAEIENGGMFAGCEKLEEESKNRFYYENLFFSMRD